jgi:iron-sulfur cluster assembly protein
MDFDTDITEMDEIINLPELKVVIDKKSVLYLFGTELQYSSGLNGKGFQWVNPNASRTCGCGESFSL